MILRLGVCLGLESHTPGIDGGPARQPLKPRVFPTRFEVLFLWSRVVYTSTPRLQQEFRAPSDTPTALSRFSFLERSGGRSS